jgi:dTMP kinase
MKKKNAHVTFPRSQGKAGTVRARVMERGALICLEGIDHSGKTTQAKLLCDALRARGVSVESLRFPDRSTRTGRLLDEYLRCAAELDERAQHLVFAANRWEKAAEIVAALRRGTTLILDRYSYSGVAYTAAKGGDVAWCKAPERGLPKPDLVAFLTLSPQEALARGGAKAAERYDSPQFLERAAQVYAALDERDGTWARVDAARERTVVLDELVALSLDAIRRAKHADISTIAW